MTRNPAELPLIRHWEAAVPIAMSLLALGLVLGYAAIVGVQPQQDEGTAAHLWQLLMTLQMPIVAYFAIKWLPRQARAALLVLVLQGGAWLASLAALYWLEKMPH